MSSSADARYVLKALTTVARVALGADAWTCAQLPLRVGRDTRTAGGPVPRDIAERRAAGMKPNNDLYLRETGSEIFVSREHFLIERVAGEFLLVDRQSTLGTWVEGHLVGGEHRGGDCRLLPGDVIIPGSFKSGFIFKFLVDDS